jgi:glycosyl transferase family 25
MKVYVISLKGARERRSQIESQMTSIGLDFEFFDGISGSRSARYVASIREEEFLLNTGRRVTAGEVGCYASHRCLWKRCVDEDAPILIMEDDVRLVADIFHSALEQTADLIERYGFIRLQEEGQRRPIRKHLVQRTPGFDVYFCASYPYGAACYAISPEAARVFAQASRILTGPVDLFIKQFWNHHQPLFMLDPSPVVNGDLSTRSTIEPRIRCRNPLLRARRSMYKLGCAISRERFLRNKQFTIIPK